jgi:hypothetical protein
MKQSKEKIQIKGKSLHKKKVRDWLLDGILIEQERYGCSVLMLKSNRFSYRSSLIFKSKDPDNDRSFVRKVKAWRELQASFMPHVGERAAAEVDKSLRDLILYLPSDLDAKEIQDGGLKTLLDEEMALRDAILNDLVCNICNDVMRVENAWGDKEESTCGQKANLRANDGIRELELARDTHITEYNAVRTKLERLEHPLAEDHPRITDESLTRKSTTNGRQVGDSRRRDGSIWRNDIGAGPSTMMMRKKDGKTKDFFGLGEGEKSSVDSPGEDLLSFHSALPLTTPF